MISKKKEQKIKVYIVKPGTKKVWFTIRGFMFDPRKHFVGTDEAKDLVRKETRISKAKMKDEYLSIFACSTVVGRGKNKHIEFNKSVKTEANTIFIVPKKYRVEAFRNIQVLELYSECFLPM